MPAPAGAYVPAIRAGTLIFTACQLPTTGKVGNAGLHARSVVGVAELGAS
ncbi:MAG: hypothetical protein M3N09_10490 [Actinomycetota bacterium]|nr:hypothetical protein [Actinomycetota bacterium]